MPIASTTRTAAAAPRTRRVTVAGLAAPLTRRVVETVLPTAPPAPAPRVVQPRRLTERDTQMMGYHSNTASRRLRGDSRELYGLEMEVTARNSGAERDRAVAVSNVDEDTHFVDAERDGSLSSSTGVEFITRRPMLAADLFEEGGWLNRFVDRVTGAGIRSGVQPQGYGIHINVNCHGWSVFAKQAFCAAVNMGHVYHPAIAGRASGGGSYGSTSFTVGSGRQPFQGWLHRGQPAYVRSDNPDCIEVRTFQGTMDVAVIRGYIRHLQDLRTFSKRYQTLLLYTTIAARSGWFTNTEAFNFVNLLFTTRPTYAAAIAALPDTISGTRYLTSTGNVGTTTRAHTALAYMNTIGSILNVIFNPATSFRLRKEALRGAWYTTEPTGEQSGDEDYDESDSDENY